MFWGHEVAVLVLKLRMFIVYKLYTISLKAEYSGKLQLIKLKKSFTARNSNTRCLSNELCGTQKHCQRLYMAILLSQFRVQLV